MIYELRIYTALPGRMPDLLTRFRDHACRLFEKHGMTNVGFWTTAIGGRNDQLWYILGYEDVGARMKAWDAFREDPEWLNAFDESEQDGPLVQYIENRMLKPTEFSPLQ
jgi:hypothetical protein